MLGIIGGGVALLSLLRGLLRHSHLLLRVCSTCLLVVVAIAVPYLLQHTSLTNALLLAMAGEHHHDNPNPNANPKPNPNPNLTLTLTFTLTLT